MKSKIDDYIKTIEHLKKQNLNNPLFSSEIKKLEQKLEALKQSVYSKLTPWQRVSICRHPSRPRTIDYVKNICTQFMELAGDRRFSEDHAVISGLATIDNQKVMLIGQEKGCDTESRVHRNFGMVNPEGFRKALRLMKLAEKFHIPIVCLLDTPGAFPGLEAEERGQGWAIAENLREMFSIKTPIVVVVIGEGCSGGALGIGIGDSIGMLEHSYYSVISPESCATILWKDSNKKIEAAETLKLNAENLQQHQIIDAIIREPLGGAHHNPQETCQNVKQYILEQLTILKEIPVELLLEQRYFKFRRMGAFNIK